MAVGSENRVLKDVATEAKQDAANALLTTIDLGIPASLGQKTMANSMPVVLPSDQTLLTIRRDELSQYVSTGFAFATSILTLTVNTAETNLVYITNPNGSGKTFYLAVSLLTTDISKANFGTFTFYTGPTVTVNGTAMTIVNLLAGSANASVVSAFSGPTTSAKGNLVETQFYGGNNASAQNWKISDYLNPYIILPANNKLLLTGSAKANTTAVTILLKWFEA